MSYSGFNNNYFSSLFGNSENTMFGGISSSFGDYSLIRSGVYKKLLNSYYKNVGEVDSSSDRTSAQTNTDSSRYRIKSAVELDAEKTGKNLKEQETTSGSSSTTQAGTAADTSALSAIKTSAKSLADSASALASKSLYEEEELEDGSKTDVTEAVKSALKSYVDAYNTYMSNAGKSNNNSIQDKNLTMLKANASNAGLLKEVGITTGEKGKLVFDDTKVDSTNVSKVQSLFQGSGSYGDTIKNTANESYRVANSVTYNEGSGSSYSTSGAYSILGTTNSILDQYL